MKHPVRSSLISKVMTALLLTLLAITVVTAVSVFPSEITAYDVFQDDQGAVIALGNEVVYINGSMLLVIKLKDSNVKVFSAVLSSGGSEIFIAGSYRRHPSIGIIKLSKDVKITTYILNSINGSLFKLRIINGQIYCAGYVFDGQVYRSLIAVLSESGLTGSESVIYCKVLVISCESSCYIRDIAKLSEGDVVALGAYYSTTFYPKYQLMLLILDKGLSTCRGFILESENSLMPKNIFVVGENRIFCMAVSESTVSYAELSSLKIKEGESVKVNLLSLKGGLFSIVAVRSNNTIYALVRTSGSQYLLKISPGSSVIELTETENNPIAVLSGSNEPVLLTSTLRSHKVESITGITRITTPTDIEYSKLREVQVKVKIGKQVFELVENSEAIVSAFSVAPTTQSNKEKQSELATSLTAAAHVSREEVSAYTKTEEFRKDVETAASSNYYVLILSLTLISAYILLRTRLNKART